MKITFYSICEYFDTCFNQPIQNTSKGVTMDSYFTNYKKINFFLT